ncbi:MAG: D-alanyl-D-alanine carboxypeptidase/D-alanyl-D-alanine-endopeptidase [Chromatiales bacterium]|nr:D-alanyl-D-alanine carboxypeptidase/D-alanyl-D-alanine-endopeptidase [Chromatiales bacterium]
MPRPAAPCTTPGLVFRGFFFLLAFALPALPQAAETATELPAQVGRILDAHRIPRETLSVWVMELGEPAPRLAVNAGVPRNPASTIKLLTTWAALQELGPGYRWHTEAWLTAPVRDGVTYGDLYLRGGGDPFLVLERLWLLVRELRQQGLREIRGGLVIDNSFFAHDRTDPGAFDGQAFRAYNALPDALLVNFQSVNFSFVPDLQQNQVLIRAEPLPINLQINNRLQIGAGGCTEAGRGIQMMVGGDGQGARVTFAGQVGRNCPSQQLNRASLLPGPAFAYGVLRALWQESGGTLQGGLRLGQVPGDATRVLRFASPPLGELVRPVNKWSNNVMTEHLFLTIGAERFGAPGTPYKARDAVLRLLGQRGLDFPELVLDNGSGLSRETRISAESLGRLLVHAWDDLYAPEFISSMSLAGIDGTMRRRFGQPPGRGRMHLKTGRLEGTLALAGYVHATSGRRFVLVSLHEHPDATRGPGEEAQDALLNWLLRL